jgi:hypothetical protein
MVKAMAEPRAMALAAAVRSLDTLNLLIVPKVSSEMARPTETKVRK